MLKNGEYYKNFEKWPILFIDDYDELTADFLQNLKIDIDISLIDMQNYM